MADIDPETGWFVKTNSERSARSVVASSPAGNPRTYWYYDSEASRITWSGNGRKAFHQCRHTKTVSFNEGGESTVFVSSDSAGVHPWGHGAGSNQLPVGLACMYHEYAPTIYGFYGADPEEPFLSRLDWGSARSRLFQDIMGTLPVDISVPLNVIEFGQLKRLVPSMAKSVNSLLAWCKHGPYRKARIRVSRLDRSAPWKRLSYVRNGYYEDRVSLGSLRWGLKDLSSSYLASTFGLRPLIDDVTNWVTKYYQIKLKSDWYKLVSDGKVHTMHAATPEVTATSSADCVARLRIPGGYSYPWDVFTDTISGKRHWTKTARGILGARVSLEPKSPMAQCSAALSSVLGLNAPLSTVWDAIPFSFVADWLIPVGEAIKRADEQLFGGVASRTARYRIHSTWHTIYTKEEKYVELQELSFPRQYVRQQGLYMSANLGSYKTGDRTTTYSRYEGWPNISILPPLKGWSVFASITSGALLLQRVL